MPLADKKITVGIAGGIAAYKAADFVSFLHQQGAEVQVIMTAGAQEFVSPLLLHALSGQVVITDMFANDASLHIPHISGVDGADLFIIAPATANMMAKAAHGIADDVLSAAILAATCPILFVPAMNMHMYENIATQENMAILRQRGYHVLEAAEGRMACGTVGKGRFPESSILREAVSAILFPRQDLAGKKVLITAGPTREHIDPVRYISNHSSGKMGYALAAAARSRGAEVTLVSGPVTLPAPQGVAVVPVITAEEMYQAVLSRYEEMDIVIGAAAVADYRAQSMAEQKIKKQDAAKNSLQLNLVANPDILQTLGEAKTRQYLVGFAAETENLLANARRKLVDKKADMIVANDVSQPGIGFYSDANAVTLVTQTEEIGLPAMEKQVLAEKIWDAILAKLDK
ncbi:MAG: bifunctional phosphopantothenoylcysteine decarboxylase/phosphopantothenate--cysteine ligase CoaBC [Peptococcaceae bacterium]|nr:bifunctional phosphopantothenoylcysteine decarboxylase/phosphopantothenate--cysteine ligase CoaBC [Peptococcaceae bacterium]